MQLDIANLLNDRIVVVEVGLTFAIYIPSIDVSFHPGSLDEFFFALGSQIILDICMGLNEDSPSVY